MAGTIKLRWELDVVDRGGGKQLLRQDRAIRKSLEQTDRQYRKTSAGAASAAARQAASSTKVERGLRAEGRGAIRASGEVRRYAAAQREALTIGQRLISQSSRLEAAYRRQGRAAQEAGRAQKLGSAASRGGSAAAGAAGGLAAKGGGLVAAAGLGLGIASVARDSVGFEKTMAGVQARLLTTGAEMRRLSDFALELGAKTQFSGREAAAAMDELAAQGFGVNEIFKVLPGTLNLAAASGTDLASAAEIQTAALRGFGLAGSQAGRVADVLAQTANRSAVDMSDLGETLKYVAPVAKATGQSFESMLAAVGLMGNVGIKGSQAGTTLRTSLVRLTNPTDKAQNALSVLGIEAEKLRGPKGLLPLPQILEKIVKGSQGVDKGARNAALSTIFGREALSGMVALVEGGPKKYARMQRALENSSGASKRAADIMRNTVAGAWDNFTGSVETASVKLTRRFMPAVRGALNVAAGGVNKATAAAPAVAAGIGAGLAGRTPTVARRFREEGTGGARTVQVADPSTAARVGQKIGQVAKTVGAAAATAGKQLLDAFKPALPFFQNILLPLLKGVAKGVLGSVVVAFKILIPIIKGVATVIGFIGKLARPFRGIFEGIGTVIGFLAAGPILKLLGALGKIGIVFRILRVPIVALGTVFRGVFALAGRFMPRVAAKITGAFEGALTFLASVGGRFLAVGRSIVSKIARPFLTIGSKILEAVRSKLGSITGFFSRVGKRIVDAIVAAIKSAPGAIKNAVSSLIPGPVKDVLNKAGGAAGKFKFWRRGGHVRRYQGGGAVDALVSPGEQIVYGSQSWMVPGAPTAADNVFARLPIGAAVLTGDGQSRMAAGASLSSALASQAPHFRAGGKVTPGKYVSTSYGPPWGGIQGTGVTRTGVNLKGNPHLYGVAVDPSQIQLGSSVFAWPNPFGYGGAFRAFDTGGAIKGRRLDFYDWRGRKRQNAWGRRPVDVSGQRIHGSTTSTGKDATARVPIMLGRSRTRGGLLEDAFGQALEASRQGESIGRYAMLGQLRETLRGARTTRDVSVKGPQESSSGGPGRSSSWSRSNTAGWARAFARRHHLRISSSWRSIARNRAVGGVEGSLHTRGSQTNPHAFDFMPPKASALSAAKRMRPAPAEAMIHNAGSGMHLHVGLFRRGGRALRRFRRGGLVGALGGVTRSQGGSLDRFAAVADDALSSRLEQMRKTILARVRRGGDARVVARLQAALSVIDDTLGKRIGKTLRLVDREKARTERGQGKLDRSLRRQGIDPASVAGLGAQLTFGAEMVVPGAERNVARLKRAVAAAKKAGQPAKAKAAQEELTQAQDDLDEAVTQQVERQRDYLAAVAEAIRAAAQAQVDAAQAAVESVNIALSGLDIQQRLDRSADTPGGMAAKAQAIQSQLLPSLGAHREALMGQIGALQNIGDTAGAAAVWTQVQQAGNDIASAMADSADLFRQAALQAAQEIVETAVHGTSMAQLGQQRLELEQRIAGTYGGGGQARADYINKTLIPALNAELSALRSQQTSASQQGDLRLADQIAEAIAGKQNDLLQATLDATEEIAENTTPRPIGGTLGFTYGSESITDALISVGNGI